MNIDPRLNEENIFPTGDEPNPLDPTPRGPIFPPDNPTLPDPDGSPFKKPPIGWNPNDVPNNPPDPPRGTPGFIPDDFPDGLPSNFPPDGTEMHWWWRWISSWKKYYEDLSTLIIKKISELNAYKRELQEQIGNLWQLGYDNDSPEVRRIYAALDAIDAQINFLTQQLQEVRSELRRLLTQLAEFWSTIKRGVPSTWKKIKRTIRKWFEGRRKSRKRPPFPPRRRGPPGSASVDEIWDSIFDADFSGSMSYTGLQWAVIIEAMFLDGVVGGGYLSGDQSEYVTFQNMIDGVYEFFTEFNDPNQTYSYDDFIAILDGWIADGEQYSDPNSPPDEPQGLEGSQQGKDLDINVSSTPTITPSATPMGGQIASPEGEFAKAFARYNSNIQGKGIR